MTLQEELEIYTITLSDYEYALLLPPEEIDDIFDNGFCYYFRFKHDIEIYEPTGELPTLEKLIQNNKNGPYVAPNGVLRPRINLLKQAIDIVKKKIQDESIRSI